MFAAHGHVDAARAGGLHNGERVASERVVSLVSVRLFGDGRCRSESSQAADPTHVDLEGFFVVACDRAVLINDLDIEVDEVSAISGDLRAVRCDDDVTGCPGRLERGRLAQSITTVGDSLDDARFIHNPENGSVTICRAARQRPRRHAVHEQLDLVGIAVHLNLHRGAFRSRPGPACGTVCP